MFASQNIKSGVMQQQNKYNQAQASSQLGLTMPKSSMNSLFEKYATGQAPVFSAFKPYSTEISFSDSYEQGDETINAERRARGCYRKYTLEQKELAVAKIINGQDAKQVSKEFGIPRRNLLRWSKNGCERKQGGGRPTDAGLENALYTKIKNQQIKGEKQIRNAAIQLSKSQNFKASKGWFAKFRRRYKRLTGEEIIKS